MLRGHFVSLVSKAAAFSSARFGSASAAVTDASSSFVATAVFAPGQLSPVGVLVAAPSFGFPEIYKNHLKVQTRFPDFVVG